MTIQELTTLGNGNPVMYRGAEVVFLYMSMRFEPTGPTTSKRHPMKATIRLRSGRKTAVHLAQLSPVPDNRLVIASSSPPLLTVHPDGRVT